MPLTDLCDGLEKILGEFRKNFEKSDPGRLKSNPDLIRKLAKIHECDEATRKELLDNLHKTVPVVAESFEILIGGGWLVETGNGGCLILYNEGGTLARLNDENAGTPSNEDLCYHFSCAARLHYAGGTNIKIDTNLRKDKAQKCPVAVIPDGSRFPDVAGDWEGRRVVIECKRMSEKVGMDHAGKVVGDADRKMHKGDLRVISIEASSVIYRPEFMERAWEDEEIIGEVRKMLSRIRDGLLKPWSKCDGLIVEATVPFAQETVGPSSCKYLWVDMKPGFTDFFHKYAANPLRTDSVLLRHREIED